MNKKIIALSIFICCSTICKSQNDTIKAANLLFKKPNPEWFLKDAHQENGKTVYTYKRTAVNDKEGNQIIPNIAFISEIVPLNADVVMFSAEKRGEVPFKVISVFTWQDKKAKIKYKNAVGYKGSYKDANELEHTVYVVHLINKDKGVQIIMDITSELFDSYEKEFADALLSIKAFK